jgi:Domain of unknown function (DUF4333)
MTAVAAAAVVCTVLSGCTTDMGDRSAPSTATVSKEDLQKDISQRLTDAGQTPQAVTCLEDLVGQLGQSVRCDVTMNAILSTEPVVTVTSLEGTKINYDVTVAVSKTQLEATVSRLAAATTNAPIASVSCKSGLEGKLGAEAYCDVTAAGVTTRHIVDVTSVSGLQMDYGLVPVVPKASVEGSLVLQLRQAGQRPDSATCAGDLQGKVGDNVECTILTAGQTQAYILTVTAVPGGNVTYKYALKT